MFERRAFFWSLAGFLICLIPLLGLWTPGNFPFSVSLSITWPIGILAHLIGTANYMMSSASIARKVTYLFVPVPLGFFLTYAWVVLASIAKYGL